MPTTNPSVTRNPIYGNSAIWSYVTVTRGPARGPQPRLAVGTGRTGANAQPGQASQLPGYLTDQEYHPNTFDYQPTLRESFLMRLPQSIGVGANGRGIVGTYEPHDNIIGRLHNHQMRRASDWQVMGFPPNVRQLLAWQQVQKYRVLSNTLSARPLPSSNYFLGYQIDSQVSSSIGASGLGYMGG